MIDIRVNTSNTAKATKRSVSKFYYHWLLQYFAKFPVRVRCSLSVIIDERDLPRNAVDPYTLLKMMLNHAIRRDHKETRDVVTRVHRWTRNAPISCELRMCSWAPLDFTTKTFIYARTPIKTKSNLPDASRSNSVAPT